MFSSTTLLVLLASYPALIFGQGHASSDQISTSATQYDNLFLSAPYPDGFGIPLKAQAVLNVTYPSGPITNGKSYSAEDVKTLPTITLIPGDTAAFKAPNAFTLILADANALGNPDKEGNYRHFLENGATFGDAGADGGMAMNVGSGTVVTSYAGPGPLLNTGEHRYAWMLFVQPSKFAAPSNLSAAGTAPGHWYVNAYVASSGLGDLVAASFFTVENGHATFPHNATVVHSTPTAGTANSSAQSGSASAAGTSNNAGKSAAKSDADGPVWKDCAATVKSLVMGLGVAVSGYILIQ
ncbi:hypothetical protein PGT21_017602 [Puccinia graminis f. sp. tritici]|uniref:PEBP-like protein n=1 Tax=Puccinia graminis f. sp. tritici TaxID=56615 RepID=A0A5B0PVY0_PUCGR|nr:hypothetical protein PGT21_017602 [Puccinia graminis f. sp. tritici]KAA1105173.1 hypothetical protein PGTUg99_004360 [Puccinia graminis f. sp. tritici]